MASGGRWKKDKKEEDDSPGFGAVLAGVAVGAGILVAALRFRAKKLYDYVTEESKAEKKLENCYSSGPSSPSSYSPPNLISAPSSTPRERPTSDRVDSMPRFERNIDTYTSLKTEPLQPVPSVNLAERLEEYYQNYVRVPDSQTSRTQRVVVDIKTELLAYLREFHQDFTVSMLNTVGSGAEDTQAISTNDWDVMVLLNMDPVMWTLTNEDKPQHYTVKRVITEETPVESHEGFDKCINENLCLTPNKLVEAFSEKLEQFVQQTHSYPLEVTSNNPHDPGMSLEVAYDEGKRLTINFIPTVCLNGILASVLPLLTPRGYDSIVCHGNVWQRSHFSIEAEKLQYFDQNKCCHLAVLKIIKAIRLNFPAQFGVCGSYVYKMVLLNMMKDVPDEDFWQQQCLQEQFVDFLNELMMYLQQRNLPHVLCEGVNLLEALSPATCDSFVNFISQRIGKEKLHTLLITNYKPE